MSCPVSPAVPCVPCPLLSPCCAMSRVPCCSHATSIVPPCPPAVPLPCPVSPQRQAWLLEQFRLLYTVGYSLSLVALVVALLLLLLLR